MQMKPAGERACRRNRLRDFALYLLISIAMVCLALGLARTSLTHDELTRWGGLAANTLFLFGFFISQSREAFTNWRFWGLFVLLLGAHLAVFIALLISIQEWRLIWFAGMALEYPLLVYLREMMMTWLSSRSSDLNVNRRK
jgi:hypothetical protein